MSGPSSAFALLGGIRALPVVAIDHLEDAIPLADALAEGGLPAIEVTLRTAAAFDAIAKLQKERPKLLIGAGAKILGNIEVGHCSKVAAGSVVLKPVPANSVVAGVPARIVGEAGCDDPRAEPPLHVGGGRLRSEGQRLEGGLAGQHLLGERRLDEQRSAAQRNGGLPEEPVDEPPDGSAQSAAHRERQRAARGSPAISRGQ